jgi:hypothetical protein
LDPPLQRQAHQRHWSTQVFPCCVSTVTERVYRELSVCKIGPHWMESFAASFAAPPPFNRPPCLPKIPPPPPTHPMLKDLGVGDLAVYGHPTTSTPHIDALAESGVRFTAWYSGFHICSPSRAAMLTGRLCVRSGTCGKDWKGGVFSNKPVGGLPTNETTFATALKTVGYTTAAMGKWHLYLLFV